MLSWRCVCIPRHVCPSPRYPLLQEHANEPSVFTHAALLSHKVLSLAHSSMSKKKTTDKQTNKLIGRLARASLQDDADR